MSESSDKSEPLRASLFPVIPIPGMVIGSEEDPSWDEVCEPPLDRYPEGIPVNQSEEDSQGYLTHTTIEVIDENVLVAIQSVIPLSLRPKWWSIDIGTICVDRSCLPSTRGAIHQMYFGSVASTR